MRSVNRFTTRPIPKSYFRLKVELKETKKRLDEICEALNVFALTHANKRWPTSVDDAGLRRVDL